MFAEKYGEVVLLSHGLSLFRADAGVESSHYFLLIDGLPNITQRMKLHFCSGTFFTVAFHSLFTTAMKVLKKKNLAANNGLSRLSSHASAGSFTSS